MRPARPSIGRTHVWGRAFARERTAAPGCAPLASRTKCHTMTRRKRAAETTMTRSDGLTYGERRNTGCSGVRVCRARRYTRAESSGNAYVDTIRRALGRPENATWRRCIRVLGRGLCWTCEVRFVYNCVRRARGPRGAVPSRVASCLAGGRRERPLTSGRGPRRAVAGSAAPRRGGNGRPHASLSRAAAELLEQINA